MWTTLLEQAAFNPAVVKLFPAVADATNYGLLCDIKM